MDGDNLFATANSFILDKLISLFSINKDSNHEQFEKFTKSFEGEDIKRELKYLYMQPKKVIVFGMNKDQCVLNPKDHRKKAILLLKTNKEEELSEDMKQNFLFIELNKKVLDEMYILCKDILFPMLTQSVQQGETSEQYRRNSWRSFIISYHISMYV